MDHQVLKVSRLEALVDGIFAIAMTILVLNLSIPQGANLTTLHSIMRHDILHKLFIYGGSFIILGTYWVGMDFIYGFLSHVTRPYLWFNIFFLMHICIVPFSASILGSFPHERISIDFYAYNLLGISMVQLFIWWYAQTYHLNIDLAHDKAISRSLYRRILTASICYLGSLILARWNTDVAFIVLILPPLIYIIPGGIDKHLKEL